MRRMLQGRRRPRDGPGKLDTMYEKHFFASRVAMVCAGVYVLVFLCAAVVPLLDHRTFSGLLAVLLAWPWVDYLPAQASGWYAAGCVLLNAAVIYAVVSLVVGSLKMFWGETSVTEEQRQKTYSLEEALKAQKALRSMAGLGPEQFPIQAFVGMISDEIEALRKQGRSDEEIARMISQNSKIVITGEEIGENYASPGEREGAHGAHG